MTHPSDTDTPITSLRNPLVKRARALRSRDQRLAEGVILVEGLRAIIEADRARVGIETIIYAPERLRSELARETITQAQSHGATIITATAEVLDSLSDRDASQGAIAIAQRPYATIEDIPLTGTPLVIALHEPQDPGNVGTIARTADSAGAAALVTFGAKGVDSFDPKAIRASMGSIFSLPVIALGPTEAALAALTQRNLTLVGAAGGGTVKLWEAPLARRVVILMGTERAGLPDEALAKCDVVARIPLAGHADSLNVAAAAAIMLFEAVRQRAG